jgi:hypothetical protein
MIVQANWKDMLPQLRRKELKSKETVAATPASWKAQLGHAIKGIKVDKCI